MADPSPKGLLERLRSAGLTRDAFLLGRRSTLHAFLTPFPTAPIRHVYAPA